jgi:hypothetical protein
MYWGFIHSPIIPNHFNTRVTKLDLRCVEEFNQKGSRLNAKKVTCCFLISWMPIVSCDRLNLLGREILPLRKGQSFTKPC